MFDIIKCIWNEDHYRKLLLKFGLIGLFMRLIFIPFTMHSDIFFIHVFPSKLAHPVIFNIYKYIGVHFYDALAKQGHIYYPPLTYFLLGSFHVIFKFIMPSFGNWLNDISQMFVSGDYSNYLEIFKIPLWRLGTYISFMKIPYFLFDLLCALVLLIFFKSTEKAIQVFKFWMINPVVIFGSYIFGQLDIIIAFFLLLALLLFSKGRIYVAMFIIGSSVLLKSSPLVLILPLIILASKNFRQAVKLTFVTMIPILATILPLYMSTGSYVLNTLFPTYALVLEKMDLVEVIWYLIGRIIFASGYLLIIYRLLSRKRDKYELGFDIWRYMLSMILLSYFIFYTPIHYFQWVIPFLIIGIVNKNILIRVYLLQIICLFIYAINSASLSGRLFTPLNPEYFYYLKGFPEFMNQFVRWGVVMAFARLIFYCCSLFMIWKVLFKPEVENV